MKHLVSSLVNWCQHWFEFFPNPPINVLGIIENLLAHHDKELLQHLMNYNITSQVKLKPGFAKGSSRMSLINRLIA